ncbi:MAG: hypothetical protein BGN96_07565 [Bacteroidales bacterium 45-6]|nr:MAG: hypothetical protein BGN96_07565 [Bacteroidales bacterium 45-6]
MPIVECEDLDDAIAWGNDCEYGLTSSVYNQSMDTTFRCFQQTLATNHRVYIALIINKLIFRHIAFPKGGCLLAVIFPFSLPEFIWKDCIFSIDNKLSLTKILLHTNQIIS